MWDLADAVKSAKSNKRASGKRPRRVTSLKSRSALAVAAAPVKQLRGMLSLWTPEEDAVLVAFANSHRTACGMVHWASAYSDANVRVALHRHMPQGTMATHNRAHLRKRFQRLFPKYMGRKMPPADSV